VVGWAADEAAARGAELRLTTAVPGPAASGQYIPSEAADAVRRAAHNGLVRAAAHAATGRTARRDAAERGNRCGPAGLRSDDQSPFAEAITGSVPGTLLTTSPCPAGRRAPHGTDAPVLVAFDEPGTSQAALAYAFAAAAGRGGACPCSAACRPTGTTTPISPNEHGRSWAARLDLRSAL
jgi:hypothetical protein